MLFRVALAAMYIYFLNWRHRHFKLPALAVHPVHFIFFDLER